MRASKHVANARRTIYSQEHIPLSIKRKAWILLQHELEHIDGRAPTQRRALSNILKWMAMEKARQESGLKKISPMQRTIIEMLVLEGLSYKEIALRLDRNLNTIKHHCKVIRRKVGVNSMYQVVAVAVDLGWILAPEVKE